MVRTYLNKDVIVIPKYLSFFKLLFVVCLYAFSSVALTHPGDHQMYLQPNAGRILNEQSTPNQPTPERETLQIESPAAPTVQSGEKVQVRALQISGNTLFSTQQIMEAAKFESGMYDFGALQQVASRIDQLYRKNGYPFSRAVLPPQTVEDGSVKIEVLEGRYGDVSARGSGEYESQVNDWLSSLKSGEFIEESLLERTTLLLRDLPGVVIRPVVKPGADVGRGDLSVDFDIDSSPSYRLGFDNFGNRYTGYNRIRFDYANPNNFALGDLIQFGIVKSEDDLSLFNLGYSRPIGFEGYGISLNIGYADYGVGRELAAAGLSGESKTIALQVYNQLVRTNVRNVKLFAGLEFKELSDSVFNANSEKENVSIPIGLSFDIRDGKFGRNAVTYGSARLKIGSINFNQTAALSDIYGIEGNFSKFMLDVTRIQSLSSALRLNTRLSLQETSTNLDSSEDFLLGGPYGVRAYPLGEAPGDRGYLVQVQLEGQTSFGKPYLFYDFGSVKVTADRSAGQAAVNEHRSGGGVGFMGSRGHVNFNLLLAYRSGHAPDSDIRSSTPIFWFLVDYAF